MEMNTYIRKLVLNGAMFLDENYPNWEWKIDTDKLRLFSLRNCICGQLEGDFCEFDRIHHLQNWGCAYGFYYAPKWTGPDNSYHGIGELAWWNSLDREWKELIAERRRIPHTFN